MIALIISWLVIGVIHFLAFAFTVLDEKKKKAAFTWYAAACFLIPAGPCFYVWFYFRVIRPKQQAEGE